MSDTKNVTDALETLGTAPLPDGVGRDAIHIAVYPAVAAEILRPGWNVGLLEDGRAGEVNNPIGIVDPFLDCPIAPGERFWIMLYPRTITGLRHVWSHPAFGEE